MTGNTARIEPLWAPTPEEVESDRPVRRLRSVPTAGRKARPRTFYALLAVGAVLAIVVTQLMLSIGVSQGAYQIEGLKEHQSQLSRSQQAVSERVDTLSSPQNLAANAEALGMVSNGTPVYLRLSDGAVIGSPTAASASAGTVTGAGGNLVANALLAGTPLATQQQSGTTASAGSDQGAPAANDASKADGPVAWEGALPAPTTH
jgi:hypothetical protein